MLSKYVFIALFSFAAFNLSAKEITLCHDLSPESLETTPCMLTHAEFVEMRREGEFHRMCYSSIEGWVSAECWSAPVRLWINIAAPIAFVALMVAHF